MRTLKTQADRTSSLPARTSGGVVSESYHLPDLWPGVSGVQPDRRGSASGARRQLTTGSEPTFLRRPTGSA
jgi:hypothetical protein